MTRRATRRRHLSSNLLKSSWQKSVADVWVFTPQRSDSVNNFVGSALERKETYQDPIRERTDTTTQLAELRQLMAIDVLSSFDHSMLQLDGSDSSAR
jgi:hypothetical protein